MTNPPTLSVSHLISYRSNNTKKMYASPSLDFGTNRKLTITSNEGVEGTRHDSSFICGSAWSFPAVLHEHWLVQLHAHGHSVLTFLTPEYSLFPNVIVAGEAVIVPQKSTQPWVQSEGELCWILYLGDVTSDRLAVVTLLQVHLHAPLKKTKPFPPPNAHLMWPVSHLELLRKFITIMFSHFQ